MLLHKIIFTLLLICTAHAQMNISGELNPYVMTRTADQSQINLPFRLLSLDFGFSFESFDFKTVTGVEQRYSTREHSIELREAYLAFYPNWGEVKIGKQIHSWGAADAINPTDNLNPYDYYYMFKAGTGKKIGKLSLASTVYRENYQVELIVSPYFTPNRIPYGEKDFPLALDKKPLIKYPVKNELELGVRFQTSLAGGDISLSYFKGSDRMPSVQSAYLPITSNMVRNFDLGYRKTTVLGSDFVTFLGDFTIRAEGALYNTQSASIDRPPNSDGYLEIIQDVIYSQYVIQLEYTTATDIMVSGQFIGSNTFDEKNQWFMPKSPSANIEFPVLPFNPGMGTPFAMFTNQAILISSSGVMMDDQLELTGSSMINLNESGLMLSIALGYSPWLNWKFELGTTQFNGSDSPENPFTLMQDFNHVRMGILYNF
ncbi:MAG: DUF1302 family protein [Candidatus Neomarinimicrobiota bacterium]|jgi:hypothetical protein|nr:DUF1302 family protein [Candidatus Neomarinimicrobiota bacterium]MEC9474425.1 DUF1302 family protein [Candidatus Neomarinimicrobiota bacterium]MED5248596.1 DUF1302 family protein [Candidatus Neomarinimicrobiota bacterium]MED5433609.1 DUF1302 family protein [Candidatus Neomarinimicrobiota bacterium]|tara:strand:- start:2779 stop:4065 length:1287 start_codon:yes stop_codon:yes gene_type:complete